MSVILNYHFYIFICTTILFYNHLFIANKPGNVSKNKGWIFGLKFFNCILQLQQKANSVGEQLVSNKVDAITKKKRLF